MNQVEKMILEYAKMAEKDKLEIKRLIREFDNKPLSEQLTSITNYEKRMTGPVSSNTCPTCGK